MKKKLFFIIFSLLLLLPFTSVEAANKVTVHVFYGEGCGYCSNLLDYLEILALDNEYGEMFEVEKYETWKNPSNKRLGEEVASSLNTRFSGVPFYVIGQRAMSGYLSSESDEIIKANIKYAYNNNSKDVVKAIKNGENVTTTSKPILIVTEPKSTTTTRTTTTTKGWGSVDTTTTTTTTRYSTTRKSQNEYYTTEHIHDYNKKPEKDKNGKLPEDIIKEFLDKVNKMDPSYVNLYDATAEFDEEILTLDKETKFTYEILDYVYEYDEDYETLNTSEKQYDPYVWVYKINIEGKILDMEIDSSVKSTLSVRLVNGEYKICDEDISIAESIGNFLNMIGMLKDTLINEVGAPGVLIVVLGIVIFIIVVILNFLPLIIVFIVIINVIKAIRSAKKQKQEMINNGTYPPNNNGQV